MDDSNRTDLFVGSLLRELQLVTAAERRSQVARRATLAVFMATLRFASHRQVTGLYAGRVCVCNVKTG